MRGTAVSEVLVVGNPDDNRIIVHGILTDGDKFYYTLGGNQDDPLIGREISSGWWVKARLCDSSYYIGKGEGFSRWSKKVDESFLLESLSNL